MRFLSLLLFACLFEATSAFAQPETPAQQTMAAKIEALYNGEQYDSIYALFSAQMQQALPAPKIKEFFTGLRQGVGRITQRHFTKTTNGTASYRTVFERGLFELLLSVNSNNQVSGLLVKPLKEAKTLQRNTTPLSLPFSGSWTVFWGGDTKEQNYHVETEAQKGAFDLIVVGASGKSYKTDGRTNTDYYAFGQPLTAPCDGEVVLVVDGIKDNTPGEMNPLYAPGNSVIIKTAANEYLFFGHFQQHTIAVRQGQKVATGQLLGRCGNSGNSSEPHLHFHLQDAEDMNKATGIKCHFRELIVNGKVQNDYSPVKGEVITKAKG